ncbi:MAG: M12 family metallo-peptidase [Anaerolineaceae bacterium]
MKDRQPLKHHLNWVQHKFFKTICGLLIILFFLTTFIPVNAADNPPPTITTIQVQGNNLSNSEELKLGVSKVQTIQLNKPALDQIAEQYEINSDAAYPVRFDVFENLNYLAMITKKDKSLNGGYILSGYLADGKEGSITIVSNNDVVSGILTDLGQQYYLTQNIQGQYQFEEIDQSAFPVELEPLTPETSIFGMESFESDNPIVMDTGAVIDVMVVYTDDARLDAGGTTNIINQIDLAISETNAGYERSGIYQRVNLVHSAEVNYDEETPFNWGNTLNALTSSTDGSLDQVHNLRNEYGADLVVMLVKNIEYCGIGWLMTPTFTRDSVGFSVVSRSCSTGYYSLAHETGHNMGAHHDRATDSGPGYYNYSHGYHAPNFAFRTIMSYDCSRYCPRINNWSNPDVFFGGQPTGIISTASNSADNRLTLNNTASIIANFRQSRSTPIAPSNLTLLNRNMTSIGFQFSDNSTNEVGFKVERSINGGSWIQIAALAANQTSYTDLELLCNTNYAYRVKAYTLSADSNYSNLLSTSTTACTAPDIPSTIDTIVSINAIRLNWTDVEGEEEYVIEQSVDDAKSWSTLASLPQNVTTYSITNLNPGSAYTIRLVVENRYGTNVSNPLTITTYDHAIFVPVINK